jgi:hypothetical protein
VLERELFSIGRVPERENGGTPEATSSDFAFPFEKVLIDLIESSLDVSQQGGRVGNKRSSENLKTVLRIKNWT